MKLDLCAVSNIAFLFFLPLCFPLYLTVYFHTGSHCRGFERNVDERQNWTKAQHHDICSAVRCRLPRDGCSTGHLDAPPGQISHRCCWWYYRQLHSCKFAGHSISLEKLPDQILIKGSPEHTDFTFCYRASGVMIEV